MKGRDIKGVKKKEKYPFPNCLLHYNILLSSCSHKIFLCWEWHVNDSKAYIAPSKQFQLFILPINYIINSMML